MHVTHRAYSSAISIRIKVLAKLDITESRTPQDGQFSIERHNRRIDFRVSVFPTLYGENIVLRVLDRSKSILTLRALGLTDLQHQQLQTLIAQPEGVTLIVGPTGSGKTSTLYSIVQEINAEGINIMALEDPVEYPMPRIRQTAVAEHLQLGFAEGVRAILRQDPDVILVGEIRDAETAAMAFRAAMTGHQVYATLHAKNALGALGRLQDLGIRAETMAENLNAVIAQRLVRCLCTQCRDQRRDANASIDQSTPTCQACLGQGYRGRQALLEILPIDASLADLIAQQASSSEMLTYAYAHQFQSLHMQGQRLVQAGITSTQELRRVLGLEENRVPEAVASGGSIQNERDGLTWR
jgi:general secretion pathway protein E/type IV pilus assembly protein PilB